MTIKYKQSTRKNRCNLTSIIGGDINRNNIFSHIKSIGFEIETTDLIKFTIEKNTTKIRIKTQTRTGARNKKKNKTRTRTRIKTKTRDILVNSALTNIDLEYGYFDENEFTDIIDTPEIKFKITNDSAEDSEFNEQIMSLCEYHMEDEEDSKNIMFKLTIPKNEYLTQTVYDINIREPDLKLHNCSSFTDVEWIVTYYTPENSNNVILNSFYHSMVLLKDHLSELKTIDNSQFYYLNQENKYQLLDTKINQVYVLPETSLIYYNNSIYDIPNYNINENLKIVVQMTFSCDIVYVFRIMKQLLSIQYTTEQLKSINKDIAKTNPNSTRINEMIIQTMKNENFDLDAIDNSLELVKQLFKKYNANKENSEYLFESDNTNKIKMYFFLIMYKLFIYLNSFLKNKQEKSESLFKKSLSFAVRHNNYLLYLEIKKQIRELFSPKFVGKDETQINNTILKIIHNIVSPISKEKDVFMLMYNFKYTRELKRQLQELFISNPEEIGAHFGDPLHSISSYFTYFETPNSEEESDDRDWLVFNNIDEKSTKFELHDDTIIIEFRDFPSYCYLYLLINGTNDMQKEILQNNVGTLSMKIVNNFIL